MKLDYADMSRGEGKGMESGCLEIWDNNLWSLQEMCAVCSRSSKYQIVRKCKRKALRSKTRSF